MGNAVSRVYGYVVRRPLQRYNVDHRAEKMIKKFEDPNAAPHRAPMYESDAQLLEEIRRENPELSSSAVKKDDDLHDRLKSVYTFSTDPQPDPRSQESVKKPLPRDVVRHYEDFVPAQLRVERQGQMRTLPRGKVSIDQAVNLLTKHSQTEGEFGVEEISKEYRLNQEAVSNTVKYFQIFQMMETTTRDSELVTPDPLQAGPTWEVSTEMDPREKQKEELLKIGKIKDQHKLRVEQERKSKQGKLHSGEEDKT
eukprot:GFUD01039659.1.p1 GENE.GFUD01039659.1~~GFUD01039659.1.p1  ORF type:complete len:253 (-),score=88.13 GFUD01039659.1:129-887(-)